MDKDKLDRLRAVSNNASRQASADCAEKIKGLNLNQLDSIIEELQKSGANRAEVTRLSQEMQTATDKNKTMRDFVNNSENVCQAVAGIIGRIL